MSDLPRILIGTPIYDGKEYCRKEFVANVKNLSYPNKTFIMVDNSAGDSYVSKLRKDKVMAFRVPRGRNSRDALANASNYLRQRALDGGYDYLFMLESDVFPPGDVIERLLSHMDTSSMILQEGKRVVGAPYHISDGKTNHLCVFMPYVNKDGLVQTKVLGPQEDQAFLDGTLKRVHGMGVGCTLIHRSVLEKYRFWYSELDDDRMSDQKVRKHPDVYFYLDLHNDGVPAYCDTSVYALHRPSDWRTVKDI